MDTFIIDAYNVIHAWNKKGYVTFNHLDEHSFLHRINIFADSIEGKVIVVFDGNNPDADSLRARFKGIEIIYSRKESSADAIIEKMVHEKGEKEKLAVVTSDRIESHIAAGGGAEILSPSRLWELTQNYQTKMKSKLNSTPYKPGKKGFTIGEIIDSENGL